MSNYYEALREVVESICQLHGWNVYSHEALTSFLAEILREETIARKFDRFRKIRNGINYYGKRITAAESSENKKEILKLIETVKSKYLSNI